MSGPRAERAGCQAPADADPDPRRPGRQLHRGPRELTAPPTPAPDALAAVRADPQHAALATDFDGTLSAIVEHPADAVPIPGVVALLTELVGRYHRVAVVSGRPVDFLRAHLPVPGLALVGQYGLERLTSGEIEVDERAAPYTAAVAVASDRADAELTGVVVERKGTVAVTLHWRQEPAAAAAASAWADAVATELGLVQYPTRMAVELRPPVPVDKGTAVRDLVDGMRVAMFAGDDHGDLSAFGVLEELRDSGALSAIARVAVRSIEEPAELVARADVAVDGPPAFVELLRSLVAPR